MKSWRLAIAMASVVASAAAAGAAASPSVQTAESNASASARLLDVPYLPQTADLCGGAAVAMVLRYWGERQVYPEDFAALVDRSASGIATDVLTLEVNRRGWQASRLDNSTLVSGAGIGENITRGRPVIALIEVAPARYHYVVVVGWTAERVIVHDPAREPFHAIARADFERAWALAGRWALLVTPPIDRLNARVTPFAPSEQDQLSLAAPCADLVREMVARSRGGDLTGADAGLAAAVALCPQYSPAWRELAGVRFLQSRWAEASGLAERAAELDPRDAPGWDLLATSRFLNDEPEAALEAWNRIDRPAVDLVRVEGTLRSRQPVVAGVVNLAPRTLLTAELYSRAVRRLRELPSAAQTGMSYRPLDGGIAEIDVIVVERRTVPRGAAPIAAAAARAWLQREVRLDVAAPTGSGELWTAAWRWWEARPRVAFALAMPAPGRLPGFARVDGSWERQSYAASTKSGTGPLPAIFRAERRRASFGLADWANGRLRWAADAALDRFSLDSYVALHGSVARRLAGDLVSIDVDTGAWAPIGSGTRFATATASSAWRSTREPGRPSWQASAGVSVTTARAPFDLWPGAGADDARVPLLRAHPLLDHGVLAGPVFGRRLAHSTVEYQYPLLTSRLPGIRVAAFADIAHAWQSMSADSSPLHADVGAGVRVVLPGGGGIARIDAARGLRDGAIALSAGWQAPWPRP